MTKAYDETSLLENINSMLNFAKSTIVENAANCAGSIRSALEYAVKLFWLKKYDKTPVWINSYNGKKQFFLSKAINDKQFSQYFDQIAIGDMNTINKMCSDVIHNAGAVNFTLERASELIRRLEKCIKEIEEKIPMKIILPIKPPEPKKVAKIVFIVMQGMTFEPEYHGGFIWAPIEDNAGGRRHFWERLCAVKKGDIILHCEKRYIRAVSVAKGKCYDCDMPKSLPDCWERKGRMVDCNYILLNRPLNLNDYCSEIKEYGQYKYSPFNINGGCNQGYLFELCGNIKDILIGAIIQKNPLIEDKINKVLLQ